MPRPSAPPGALSATVGALELVPLGIGGDAASAADVSRLLRSLPSPDGVAGDVLPLADVPRALTLVAPLAGHGAAGTDFELPAPPRALAVPKAGPGGAQRHEQEVAQAGATEVSSASAPPSAPTFPPMKLVAAGLPTHWEPGFRCLTTTPVPPTLLPPSSPNAIDRGGDLSGGAVFVSWRSVDDAVLAAPATAGCCRRFRPEWRSAAMLVAPTALDSVLDAPAPRRSSLLLPLEPPIWATAASANLCRSPWRAVVDGATASPAP